MAGASGSWNVDPDAEYVQQDIEGGPGSGVLDDAGYYWGQYVENPAYAVGDAISNSVRNKLAELQSAGQQFAATFATFHNLQFEGVGGSSMAPQYGALYQRAQAAQSTLDSIASAASTAWGYTKAAFGLAGARNAVMQRSAGLGVLPAVLGYAVIAGAVVLVVGLTSEMAKFVLNYRLVQQGKPPIETSGGGIFSDVSGSLKWLALAGVALYIVPELLKGRK